MELVGKEPGIIHGTLHYFVDGKHASKGGKIPVENTDTDIPRLCRRMDSRPHRPLRRRQKVYQLRHKKRADNGQNPFRKPHYLILNLALGGSWGGPIDDSIFPQRMTIAYVRVYQK